MPACPRCDLPMRVFTVTTDREAWQIEIDVCADGCGGLWLEAHDFEADAKANLLLDAELLTLNRPARESASHEGPAHCPECKALMHRYDWNNEGIHLDSCPAGHGRWVDGGELEAVHRQWGVEPVSEAQQAALAEKARGIRSRADASEPKAGFWQRCLDALIFP